ncbi:MAG: hypothetical protein Q8O52_08635 [Sulfuritalea sp.]|nr:hypothetical protein [Sulfuritalea sp.]
MSDASENSATQKWIDHLSRMPRDHLGYREWFYITGIGLGDFGLYNISNSGVGFNKFSNQSLQYTSYEEREILMGIDYQTPLTFPCTLQELFDFVDGPAGQFGGVHFTLRDGFREAAAEILAKSSTDQAERDIQDTPTSGDSGMTGGSPIVGAGDTAIENSDIPGKLPRVAIGRLAVTAAWQIERETNRAATADKVIERLQAWATDGKHPDILLRAEPKKRSVIWMPKKTGLEKDYDVGACGKTLAEWRKGPRPGRE